MKKNALVVLILAGLFELSAQEKNNELLTVATFVVGDVSLVRMEKSMKVTKNFIFATGDEVVTKKGTVDIQFGPGAVVRVANNTKIKIAKIVEAQEMQRVNLGLSNGKIFSKVAKQSAPKYSFQIFSNSFVAAVRGTEFLVTEESEPDLESEKSPEIPGGVFVKTGEVAVQTKEEKESLKEFSVKAGEEVVVTTNGIKKQLLEEHIKEKLKILDTLTVMQEANYKLIKEMRDKNRELMKDSPGKAK